MNIQDFFAQPIEKQNMEYFAHLVRIAKADNLVSNAEVDLLNKLGHMLGFTDHEIENLIESAGKSDFSPPYEFSKRFEQVYHIVHMSMADKVVDNSEMRLASSFAIKAGFDEKEISKLLDFIINGIKKGVDEEDLFEAYKKERRHWV